MAVVDASDGVKIGSDSLPVYLFDEWMTDETVSLGTMSADETRTLVFNGVETLREGSKIFATPQNPQYFLDLEIRHVWQSGQQQVSVYVKNKSSETVYTLEESWTLSYWNTSAAPVP